jgi:hypothetical protein
MSNGQSGGYQSIKDFSRAFPEEGSAMCITMRDSQSRRVVDVRYFCGNDDRTWVANHLTAWTYVNGYTATIEMVRIP